MHAHSGIRLHVISVGAFGAAVANYLAALSINVEKAEWAGNEGLEWPAADVRVVASWRPVPALCRLLDERSHQLSQSFLPIVLEGSSLTIGPVIVPRRSGCWQCWELRTLQHSTSNNEARMALLQFYEANPQAGAAGYIEPFAMIAAAKVAEAIQSDDHLQQQAGHIWRIDLFTREVSTGYLIGVDGCPRCGVSRSLESRTYVEMREGLKFLRDME